MTENLIDEAIFKGKHFIEAYLENVTAEDFAEHIADLKKRYTDKAAIQQAIDHLQKLL